MMKNLKEFESVPHDISHLSREELESIFGKEIASDMLRDKKIEPNTYVIESVDRKKGCLTLRGFLVGEMTYDDRIVNLKELAEKAGLSTEGICQVKEFRMEPKDGL